VPFNLGPEKILVILVFALVFLGPDKLPEAARKIGELVGHARRMSGGLQSELRQAIDEPLQTFTREFTAGEQHAIGSATASAPEVVDSPEAATAPAADPHSVEAPSPEVVAAEPAAPLGPSPEPVPAAPTSTPALPSWVFPGASAGSTGPGFH
jgi:sec-independent protein translocase protein TatB